MPDKVKITRALISVYDKNELEPVVHLLVRCGIDLVSTGGTRTFIEQLGYQVTPVEEVTGFPSIFGGRVKTLHPAIFGGILFRRDEEGDQRQASEFSIPAIDLVVVDLYPFEETIRREADEDAAIEKIDIGGVSLVRAAAKNHAHVLVVASREDYPALTRVLERGGTTAASERKQFATRAFDVTSHYDTAIFNYFNRDGHVKAFKVSSRPGHGLRYGENPHQKGSYYGDLWALFDKLHGKQLSFNNLVDLDAALALLEEFHSETAFVIIKHTNACGVATAPTLSEAYRKALQADTISAYGGVLACNGPVTAETARLLNDLFFEILVAPHLDPDALELLTGKKNRIILRQKESVRPSRAFRSLLRGVIEQDTDLQTETTSDLKTVTRRAPTASERGAMIFALKVVKHSKSNAIVLAVEGQMLASGVGQTSRVDALKQAIEKAASFGLRLDDAVMASDAFFPFPDCVETAHASGIKAVVQPGGSVRDRESIDFCDQHGMAMAFTGYRHFRH